jgi:S-adenosylmethionine decarboxylase proenzyme
MQAIGRHLLVDLYGCDRERLDDPDYIAVELQAAATAAGSRVLGTAFHRFSPGGITGVLIVQESHLAVHTWPERGYAALDLFTCGRQTDPWAAYQRLKCAFGATRDNVVEVSRGLHADK